MMTREELLSSREYWISQIQLQLFNIIEDYRRENNLKKTDLARELGVTKGYITQILNGDFDHKISKLVDLALAFKKVPIITYKNLQEYIIEDAINAISSDEFIDSKSVDAKAVCLIDGNSLSELVNSGGGRVSHDKISTTDIKWKIQNQLDIDYTA